MNRRYRKRNKSQIGEIISDSAEIASLLPWWGSLLFGALLYVFFSILICGYFEDRAAAIIVNQPQNYAINALSKRGARLFDWIGIVSFIVCFFFTVRNYFFDRKANRGETHLVSFFSKIVSRFFD